MKHCSGLVPPLHKCYGACVGYLYQGGRQAGSEMPWNILANSLSLCFMSAASCSAALISFCTFLSVARCPSATRNF